MITIILIRHAEKVSVAHSENDSDSPLSAAGRKQVSRLARRLAEMHLRSEIMFSSRFRHAMETAARLHPESASRGLESVIELPPLTPHTPDSEFRIEIILTEARRRVRDSDAAVVACVGHEPRLGELVEQMTRRRIDRLDYAGAVGIESASFAELARGRGQVVFRV